MAKKKSGNKLQQARTLRPDETGAMAKSQPGFRSQWIRVLYTDEVGALCSALRGFVRATAMLNEGLPTRQCSREDVAILAQLRDAFWRLAKLDWEPPQPYSRVLASDFAELREELQLAALAWQIPDSRLLNEVVEAVSALADKFGPRGPKQEANPATA